MARLPIVVAIPGVLLIQPLSQAVSSMILLILAWQARVVLACAPLRVAISRSVVCWPVRGLLSMH